MSDDVIKARILLVDDEPNVLRALNRILRSNEWEILSASGGAEALESLSATSVDLVVSDLRMPGMSGVEFLREVSGLYPDLPRILLTGSFDLPEVIEAVNQGQISYLIQKPWNDDNLRLAVREFVQRHRLSIAQERLNRMISSQNQELQELNAALRDRQEALKEQVEARSRMMAVLSHEIRTPLNGIMGVVQLLQDRLGPEYEELLRLALDSAMDMNRIVDGMLDFFKLESGKMELELSDFDPGALVSETIRLMEHAGAARNLALNVVTTNEFPAWIRADRGRLRQVLLNLVSNAIKFTLVGEVRVECDCLGNTLIIRVVDTGIGIPDDMLPRLFREFDTLANVHDRLYDGTGLGLAISRRLIRLMGGDIEVSSVPGEGSVFTIRMLFGMPVEPAHSAVDEQPQPLPRLGITVMLVDDHESNRLVHGALLETWDCEVIALEGARATIDHFEGGGRMPDVILMDISMPEMNGMEVTRYLLSRALVPNELPIVALTAHSMEEQIAAFLRAGMCAHLSKPVTSEALRGLLSRVLPAGIAVQAESPDGDQAELPPPSAADDRESGPGHDVALLDERVLGGMQREIGMSVMPKLVESFVRDTLSRIEAIERGIAGSDPATLSRESHALGSSAGQFGAEQLYLRCRAIEAACKQHDDVEALELAGSLRPLAEASVEALTDWLEADAG